MLKLIVLAAIGLSGWGLGRVRLVLQLPVLVLTFFAAVSVHSAIQWAFIDGPRLDSVVGDPRNGASDFAVVLIAAGEAAGLWVPFLILPWAQMKARVWAALYFLAACTIAAIAHYLPFDAVLFNSTTVSPDGPPYLLAPFACLPIGLAGFLFGWTQRKRAELDA